MKKAIAMKCTQEQWDSIKSSIPEDRIYSVTSFEKYPWIFVDKTKQISNIKEGEYWEETWKRVKVVHKTFNAKIFLEACGIDCEPKYSITKLQLTQLLKNNEEGNDQLVSADLRAWFPGAFKNELEVGKWYKSLEYPKQIVFVVGFETVQRIKGYGFDVRGNWEKDNNHFPWGLPIDGNFEESTPQEVEAALISEWKKRGGKNGVYFNEIPDGKNNPSISQTGHCGSAYKYEDGVLYTVGRGKWCIYKNGQWATIIQPEKMTLEQIEKELGRKIELI